MRDQSPRKEACDQSGRKPSSGRIEPASKGKRSGHTSDDGLLWGGPASADSDEKDPWTLAKDAGAPEDRSIAFILNDLYGPSVIAAKPETNVFSGKVFAASLA
jgi:hypothetical protein